MLEPLRNPANWDNFRKAAVLVLILWAAASVLFGIIYFFILGAALLRRRTYSGRYFACPLYRSGRSPTGSSSRTRRRRQSGGRRRRIGAEFQAEASMNDEHVAMLKQGVDRLERVA